MPLPEIVTGADPCRLASRWTISEPLARKLVLLADRLPFPVRIISGHRSVELQRDLARQGRPAADPDRSTHTSCPATGADLWPSIAVTPAIKARVGREAVEVGLRWGGGSPVDSGGIPSDWNHFDLGPRALSSR